jgi:predicted adenylyl cyclase CyaB
MEVNNESEFQVSDAGEFEEFLDFLGMKLIIKKEKQGCAFRITAEKQVPVLAELSMVKGLGWFLELEILADNRDDYVVEASRKRFYDLLECLGIPPDKIEDRPYTVMLQENCYEL